MLPIKSPEELKMIIGTINFNANATMESFTYGRISREKANDDLDICGRYLELVAKQITNFEHMQGDIDELASRIERLRAELR